MEKQAMSENLIKSIIGLYLAFANEDGIIEDSEMNSIINTARKMLIENNVEFNDAKLITLVEDSLDYINSIECDVELENYLYNIKTALNAEQAQSMIADLIVIAKSDNRVDSGEKKIIKAFAKIFNIELNEL